MADMIDRRRRSGWRLALGMVLCVVGAAVPTRGFASFQNGNTLWADCNGKADDWFIKGYCAGYISSISDALDGNAIDGYRACLPNGVTIGQVQDVVVKWLRAHPEKRHFQAAGLVAQALEDAFPCK